MREVSAVLNSITQTLAERDRREMQRDRLEAERRKLDDERDAAAKIDRDRILSRMDNHEKRTTTLETQWAAFFGDQGAFKLLVRSGIDQGKKLDRNTWLIAVGFGMVIAAEFFLRK